MSIYIQSVLHPAYGTLLSAYNVNVLRITGRYYVTTASHQYALHVLFVLLRCTIEYSITITVSW